MRKPRSFIAFLLIMAIMFSPVNYPVYGNAYESPPTLCGDSFPQNETQEDNGSEDAEIIAVIIVVIIIILIIYYLTDADNPSRR